jgi:hypothetical protein
MSTQSLDPTVTTAAVQEIGPRYRLAAAGREATEDQRLSLLEQIYDPGSRRRRQIVQPGWRCLEIGAGRGSMALWLAGQVGPSGEVVATDIDVTYLRRLEAQTSRSSSTTSSTVHSGRSNPARLTSSACALCSPTSPADKKPRSTDRAVLASGWLANRRGWRLGHDGAG